MAILSASGLFKYRPQTTRRPEISTAEEIWIWKFNAEPEVIRGNTTFSLKGSIIAPTDSLSLSIGASSPHDTSRASN